MIITTEHLGSLQNHFNVFMSSHGSFITYKLSDLIFSDIHWLVLLVYNTEQKLNKCKHEYKHSNRGMALNTMGNDTVTNTED